jgi:preprotein translocase subunit SecG
MYQIITILAVFAALILIILVLAQNSKGGGLAAGFSSSNNIMGVRKTTDFVEKTTWGLAATIIVLSVFATFAMKDTTATRTSTTVDGNIENVMPQPQQPVEPSTENIEL